MALLHEMSSNLPSLRRYARMLCGTQSIGDELVLLAFETVTKIAGALERSDARIALFEVLLEYWNGPVGARLRQFSIEQTGRALGGWDASLTPARQAHLLIAMEGFSVEAAASALRLEPDRVADLIAEGACLRHAGDRGRSILIIEDELFIATELEAAVEALGHEVAGVARTARAAVLLGRDTTFDLILSDIQLADASTGIDAVRELTALRPVPVVFVTAYPERLLTGVKPEPTFVVAKPFRSPDIRATITQALMFAEVPGVMLATKACNAPEVLAQASP
ncbi:MAG: response regulator [Hyphomicrobiaceae bacterium]